MGYVFAVFNQNQIWLGIFNTTNKINHLIQTVVFNNINNNKISKPDLLNLKFNKNDIISNLSHTIVFNDNSKISKLS